MTPEEALDELIARVGAEGVAQVFISAQALSEWPESAVVVMKAQGLLGRMRVAASVVCPGCEQQCVMPVDAPAAQSSSARAFVVCDKRSDINRVPVPIELIEDWRVSGNSFANLIANLLDLRRPAEASAVDGRWEVGLFRGLKHASHLVLLRDADRLTLAIAGHSIAVSDALRIAGEEIKIDRRMVTRCVDNPIASAGDKESAAARRERLAARVAAERAKGTRGFQKVVAAEEGISKSRLKQILKSGQADNNR